MIRLSGFFHSKCSSSSSTAPCLKKRPTFGVL